MLYPKESETREVKDLSGVWKFKVDYDNIGRKQEWNKFPLDKNVIEMPVPSSYNDITQDSNIRDHIGDVWYERFFFVPSHWNNRRIALRIGSATHKAAVWINGKYLGEHKGGYLPFEFDITNLLELGGENRVTIVVNNVLDWSTLPPGYIREFQDEMHPPGYKVQEYFHDYFNYSGIHRPVKLHSMPTNYIDDLTISTEIEGNFGLVNYEVKVVGKQHEVKVSLLDKREKEICVHNGLKGILKIEDPKLWEPGNAYLYSLKIETSIDNRIEDIYRQDVGIRTVEVKGNHFLLNGKPFYFRGFGKHEDVDLRGKGLDHVTNVKDFNLMDWVGANSFRTSHYPYSEEILKLADERGIVVIDEAPAVGMRFHDDDPISGPVFCDEHISEETLQYHLNVMRDFINRDKNHPCVVLWSVANEAMTKEDGAFHYFKRVIEETRRLDSTRPVTIVEYIGPKDNRVGYLADVLCINRYFGWYSDCGKLDLIEYQLEKELNAWYEKFKKPIIITEYGADAVTGFHQDPPVMFTEEFQKEFLDRYHRVFDKMDFIIGEHIWSFADFATKQHIRRVVGNRKGVFTRQRQPKMAAYLLKERWTPSSKNKKT
ncbi:Beta-glucuronidase [subsurface metagenome]